MTANLNTYDPITPTQIDHRIYVGNYKNAADLALFNPFKITAVLCVHNEQGYEKRPDIIYMHQGFDDGYAIPEKQFEKCLAWLKFMHDAGHTILIHCAAGRSRSVVIAASLLHYLGIMTFDEALKHIAMRRPVASSPHPEVVLSAKKMLKVWPYVNDAFASFLEG
jgi:diacylglycerol kinase (ATP)